MPPTETAGPPIMSRELAPPNFTGAGFASLTDTSSVTGKISFIIPAIVDHSLTRNNGFLHTMHFYVAL